MIIVLVIDQFDSGNNGTTVTARRYAEALRSLGHTVRVVAAGAPAPDKFPVRKRYIPIVTEVSRTQGMLFAKPDDRVFLEAFKGADIIHFYVPFSLCRRGEKIARQMRIPTVAAFHMQPENVTYTIGMGKCKWLNDRIYQCLYHMFYRRFRHIHCPSQFIANELIAHGYPAKMHVISNGVDPAFHPIEGPRPTWAQGKFVVLMVGRFSGEKRQDLIIKAVKHCRHRDQIQLVFAGQGPVLKRYRRLARGLKNEPIFKFCTQQELVALFHATDLYVHASDAEIEGISCIEALACGVVPVISDSKLSATPQFSLDTRCLFRAGDARHLAERIDYWLDHPQERAALAPRYAQLGDHNRVVDCVRKAEAMYAEAIESYRQHGYLPLKKSKALRLVTPNIEKSSGLPFNAWQKLCIWLFQCLVSPILLAFNMLFFGLRIQGRKNIRQLSGGAVTVSNHAHVLDSTMVALALFPRRVTFVSMRDNFSIPFIGYLIRGLGAVSLPANGQSMNRFFHVAAQELAKGEVLHFYPEGILYPYCPELRHFYGGAFLTAQHAGVPIVPLTLTFRPRRGLYRLFGKNPLVTVRIGKPMESKSLSYKNLCQKVYAQMDQVIKTG